jgi:hypothetical protein
MDRETALAMLYDYLKKANTFTNYHEDNIYKYEELRKDKIAIQEDILEAMGVKE